MTAKIKIYNTLTGQKEEFVSLKDKKVNMFVCGPTVYDYIHIGNARTFVFFDVVAKYLKFKGYEVNYIQNITDIDNKIIERAQKEGVDPLEYAQKYTDIFKMDMEALGVTSPEYKNATDHIPEVVKQVQTLLDKGNAYVIESDPDASVGAGGIYFDLSTFFDYGKLSGRTAGMADDAVSRIDDSDKKRNRGDFAIWKFSQKGDPVWNFETGEYLGINDSRGRPAFAKASAGRPGWHIEDTAITEKYFGPQYDLHGGGQDLIFPHHEAEIAQQESASGKKPFVKYWMHVGFLVNKKQKMSKSLGNFMTLHEALETWPKEVLRFYLLSNNYRSPLDYSDESLKAAKVAVSRLFEFVQKLELATGKDAMDFEKISLNVHKEEFLKALDDDFNIPVAFGDIFEMIRNINPMLVNNNMNKDTALKYLNFIQDLNSLFGIIPSKQEKVPDNITELVQKREELRRDKDWTGADKVRVRIEEMGYEIEDTVYGPLSIKK